MAGLEVIETGRAGFALPVVGDAEEPFFLLQYTCPMPDAQGLGGGGSEVNRD